MIPTGSPPLEPPASSRLQNMCQYRTHLLCKMKGGLAIACIDDLVDYMLVSSLQLAAFIWLSSCKLSLFTAASTKYYATF